MSDCSCSERGGIVFRDPRCRDHGDEAIASVPDEWIEAPPVRPCCGKPHWGAQCPDGLVMCCLCFNRVPIERLVRLADDTFEDVCVDCEPAAEGSDHE